MPDGVTPAPDTPAPDVLREGGAGTRVVRGSVARGAAFGVGSLLTAGASVLLLRHLGVEAFGRYALVMALVAIVAGVADAGLTVVGTRALALRPPGRQRVALLGDLVGLRMVLAPAGVLLGVGFAVVAGYPAVIVGGVALAGAGLVLTSVQATLMQLLSVEMRNVRLSVAEVYRQAVTFAVIAVLVATGAGLSAFFTGQIAVGLAMLAATPVLLGRGWRVRPRFERRRWRPLLAESVPLAVSYALSLIYFRVLLVELSIVSNDFQVGLFGTSLRIFELVLGLPTLALGVALPVLTAATADAARLRHQVQRLTEGALLLSVMVAVLVAAAADPVLAVLGGAEFAPAAEILRLHIAAFVPVFVLNVFQSTLVATGHQRILIPVNAIGLAFLLVAGLVGIELGEARGAAVTAIVAEAVLGMLTFLALRRRVPHALPSFRFAWRIAVAAAPAAFVGLALGLPDVLATVLAAAVFSAVALAVGAVPPEIPHALGLDRLRPRRAP